MDRNMEKPRLTIGIVTQQTENVTGTGLRLTKADTYIPSVVEDGLRQMLNTLMLTVIDNNGIADMGIVTALHGFF